MHFSLPALQHALPDLSKVASVLLESDMVYFKLAAQLTPLRGATLARLPGLEHLSAGCVLVDLDVGKIESDIEAWLEATTEALRLQGCPRVRFYLYDTSEELKDFLEKRGFRSRTEIGFLGFSTPESPSCSVTLHRLETPSDWTTKPRLYHDVSGFSYAYQSPPDDWVEMERRKSETGRMKTFVIQSGSATCGSVSTIELGNFMRIKSLFLHPRWRGRGIGLQVLKLMARLAHQSGKETYGIFAVAGTDGEKLYRKAGLSALTKQFEWVKLINDTTQ